MSLIPTGHKFRTSRQAAQLSLKAKKLLMTAAILSAAVLLSGCHGPWFPGHGRGHGRGHGYYNCHHDSPRYQAGPRRYRYSDDNIYWRR